MRITRKLLKRVCLYKRIYFKYKNNGIENNRFCISKAFNKNLERIEMKVVK